MPSDPFQMVMIHRGFRTEFSNIASLVRAVEPGDATRRKIVGHYLENMILVLHHHHAAEDEMLFSALSARLPDSDTPLDSAGRDHADIERIFERATALRLSWQRGGDAGEAEDLGRALDDLSGVAGEHFDREEREVVPLIGEHLTQAEWQAFIDRGGAYVNPANVWFALAYAGLVLRDATPEERVRFSASLPLPLRIVLKTLGRHAYASYQKKLYGHLG
jgi:hemerythrin-like domain-containing protein